MRPGNSSGVGDSPGSRIGGGTSGRGLPGGLSCGGSDGCPGLIGGSSCGSIGIAPFPDFCTDLNGLTAARFHWLAAQARTSSVLLRVLPTST
jgi:hypothetical protein